MWSEGIFQQERKKNKKTTKASHGPNRTGHWGKQGTTPRNSQQRRAIANNAAQ